MHAHTLIHIHTQVHAKPAKLQKRSMKNTHVSFQVLTLYYTSVRCCHWGKLGKGYTGPLGTMDAVSCESGIISR